MSKLLDEKDLKLLSLLQKNSNMSIKELAKRIGSPITTVYSRIRRLERLGIIKRYTAILDPVKLGFGTTAFILASFKYKIEKGGELISQRTIARKIASLPGVQEVHIISGDWDILIKVKARDVQEVGRFVLDKLRLIEGIEKTLTCVVFDSAKESMELPLDLISEERGEEKG
ncbi:AsnC family transcriptional regulator [Candidatus Geothermarchaeota archaeon ex4572_27]|nr:MAG: AsnC family transcriptional regulator [Candidatus Geothermarchaeota archaeon ex4572_27]